jgi:hypothetical protein
MRVSNLIALAAQRALDENPTLMGVWVSPIALDTEEVQAVAEDVHAQLGDKVYVVASAPGVAYRCKGRVCLAPDSRAAEQATAWRNTVQPSRGERLVYVSVEEHEKASGLRDCLLQLTEAQLHAAFVDWCARPESGMPKGLAQSLEEARLLDGVSPAALCEYARAVTKEKERGKAETWEVAGKHLPLLGLMRDTRLGKTDTAERLEANARLVRQVATGEKRRAAAPPAVAQVTSQLKVALEESEPGLQRQALAKVDLGELRTGLIQGTRAKARAKKAAASKVEAEPKRTKEKERPASAKEAKAGAEGTKQVQLWEGTGAPAEAGAPGRGGPRPQGTSGAPRPLTAPPLPEGLTHLLLDLLGSGGTPREWRVTTNARHCLSAVPPALRPPVSAGEGVVSRVLGAAYTMWQERRQALLTAVGNGGEAGPLSVRLLVAVERLLEHKQLREAVQDYLDAAQALYEVARTAGDERALREVLALETVAIRDASGLALRLLGPLHPLWLAQAVVRTEGARADAPGETARRLLGRAARAEPVAPQLWPEDGSQGLSLARPEAGLLVYERRPEGVGGESLKTLGERLLERYLSLCPHASLGVRVAVTGGDASALVEGLAAHATDEALLRLVEVYCATVVSPGPMAQGLIQQGRLRVRALPMEERRLWEEVRPHLLVRLVPPESSTPEAQEKAALAPASQGETLHTDFEVHAGGLRAWVSLASHRVLAAVEAVHALACGQRPRGALVRELVTRPLGPALRAEGATAGGWQVAVGPGLGRQSSPEAHLLVYERLDDTTVCAVVTRDLRPAGRALSEALQRVGVQEERPMALRGLASRLTNAGTGGLVSLVHTGVHLVAGGALSLELQRRASGAAAALITPVQGSHYEALTGESAAQDKAGALLLGCVLRGGALSFQVGYATLDGSAGVELGRGLVGGAVGTRLSSVLAALELARGTGPAATAARELLGWILWPALALEERKSLELQFALRAWKVGGGETEVVCLLPPSLAGPRGRSYRLGKLPVSVAALDAELFGRLVLSQGV